MSKSIYKKIIPKTVKNTVRDQLDKNKPKLIQKASSYVLDKAIGSPYLDIVIGAGKTIKRKYLPKVTNFAAKKFIRSKYAIDRLNTIPLMIFSTILRTILTFLVFNNIKTGDKYIDFSISVFITALSTLISPFFYSIAETQSHIFNLYTFNIVDSMSRTNQYNYYADRHMLYKTLIMSGIIVILQFIQITSIVLQEMMFHSLVSSWIVEIITRIRNWKYRIKQLHYGMSCYYTTIYYLTSKNFFDIPLREIKYCNTNDTPYLIEEYIRPSRAKKICVIEDKIYDDTDYKIKNILDETCIVMFE